MNDPYTVCCNVKKKKTENQNSKIYCRIKNVHDTAFGNAILMKRPGQQEELPGDEQEELQTLVSSSIPEQ